MATSGKASAQRTRGRVETLPSGALRVTVYAGIDAMTGRRHYLRETVPAGPDAAKQAENVRIKLVNEVNQQRSPRTNATVNQLMDRYLELLDVDTTTRRRYETVIRSHVRPLIGKLTLAKLDAETIDSFYRTLRTCRTHCGGRQFVEHDVKHDHGRPHRCTDRCRPHEHQPLATATIRKIHWCLSGAFKDALRWRWTTVNPLDQAQPPRGGQANPQPPTAQEAAKIVNRAFQELRWGMFVWLAMTTGARRGELCALRWDQLELDQATVWIRTAIAQDGASTWEKDTKTHQQRRIALDAETVALLRAYRQHCDREAASVGAELADDGRVFSASVDHSTWVKPSTVSQRYRRMCKALGWDMHIHQLRHYSATELIASGVDPRTVAGRLGHGSVARRPCAPTRHGSRKPTNVRPARSQPVCHKRRSPSTPTATSKPTPTPRPSRRTPTRRSPPTSVAQSRPGFCHRVQCCLLSVNSRPATTCQQEQRTAQSRN
ncbi:site-specific integrase [Saccharomonospora sp. CUA-673]|uniref:tyrosine-type recombinase/integrase n=1 Tax=Saccharomonospora sp. CUA-673 TaxID=1904969 RepID=UPI000A8AD798|nr:site-specific integrase [Saccharomonospora sp. CUA-673]